MQSVGHSRFYALSSQPQPCSRSCLHGEHSRTSLRRRGRRRPRALTRVLVHGADPPIADVRDQQLALVGAAEDVPDVAEAGRCWRAVCKSGNATLPRQRVHKSCDASGAASPNCDFAAAWDCLQGRCTTGHGASVTLAEGEVNRSLVLRADCSGQLWPPQ